MPQVVLSYYGQSRELVKEKVIHWPGGKTSPPPDTPRCGFDGSRCITETTGKFMQIGRIFNFTQAFLV